MPQLRRWRRDSVTEQMFTAHLPGVTELLELLRARERDLAGARKRSRTTSPRVAAERFPVDEGWEPDGLIQQCRATFTTRNGVYDRAQPIALQRPFGSEHAPIYSFASQITTDRTDDEAVEAVREWLIDTANSTEAEDVRQRIEAIPPARDAAAAAYARGWRLAAIRLGLHDIMDAIPGPGLGFAI